MQLSTKNPGDFLKFFSRISKELYAPLNAALGTIPESI